MSTYTPDFTILYSFMPELLRAFLVTLRLSGIAFIIGILLGLAFALLSMSQNKYIRGSGRIVIDFLRGIPEIIQVIWIYFVLPITFGVAIGAKTAAIVGLGGSISAYLAETYRSGLASVPNGHIEAARSLGMSRQYTFMRIQLPQAFRPMVPSIMTNYVLLLKRTAILTVIGVPELTFVSQRIAVELFRPLEVYTAVAIMYLLLTVPLGLVVRRLTRKSYA